MDVVVAQSPSIFQLLSGKDQALLVGRDAFLVLDLGFHIVDRVAGLDFESNRLSREGLDEAVCRGRSVPHYRVDCGLAFSGLHLHWKRMTDIRLILLLIR